jgi:hypothetical protein
VLLAMAAVFGAGEAAAKNRYDKSSNKRYYESMMREAARQQAEAEREQREQQRDAQRAQQEAARLQAEFAAQQRQERERAMRDAERAQRDAEAAQRQAQRQAERDAQRAAEREAQRAAERAAQMAAERSAQEAAQRAAQRAAQQEAEAARNRAEREGGKDSAAWRDPRPQASVNKADRKDGGDKDAREGDKNPDEASLDDELDDPSLSAAERRVLELERRRRLDARRHADAQRDFRRKLDERAARLRARDSDRDAPDPKDAGSEAAAPGERPAPAPPPKTLLSGVQKQATKLGDEPSRTPSRRHAGRDDGTDNDAKAPPVPASGKRAAADAAGPDAKKKDDDRRAPAAGAPTGKTAKPLVREPVPADRRAPELPPEEFEQQRETELVVTALTAEEVETAEANGLEVSAPTDVGRSGMKIQRVRMKGADRSQVERELHRLVPFASVTPNHAYKIFLGSQGQAAGVAPPGYDARTRTAPASAQPCPASVCFGPALIEWTARHAACVKNVRVGVIDTSFDTSHPAFRRLESVGRAFLDGKEPSPYDWHGTAVLSLLAGNPDSGTPGLVPDATFLLAAAFRSDMNGNASTDTVRLLAALAWLEDLDVDVVNMSFSGPEDPALARAIARMSKKGILFIGAAGNMGPTAPPSYPAAYPSVIAVTAVNRQGLNYKQANRGDYVDVSAPGVDVLTALPHGQQGFRTGTSFAAPFVTAIVAAGGADLTRLVSKASVMSHVATEDLGPPGQDPIYGAGLARAPARCRSGEGSAVAAAEPVPSEAWTARTTTTFVNAGAGFAP